MATPLSELKKIRREKLDKLKKLGVDPFAFTFDKNLTIHQCLEKKGKQVKTAGRLMAMRGHGALSFADLTDQTGKVQLIFRKDVLKKLEREVLSLLDLGDIIGVTGKSTTSKSGEPSIEVDSLTMLTKSLRPLPGQWQGLKNVEERYRQRYVDLLLNPEVRKVFDTRSKLLTYFRKYLDSKGFVEVETPILQPLYGGATAKPFKTHHNSLDTDFYLRIADELYLKRLIVGGYERVYEVCKDFRNEGMDRQHNPEFTQIEFYMAYADYNDLMDISEDMLSGAVKEVTGGYKIKTQGKNVDFSPGWERVTYRDLILRHTQIDIDQVKLESDLREEIKVKKLKVNLKGVAGYANVLDQLYKEYCRPKVTGPLFLIDHPYESRPLAKRKPDEPEKVASVALLIAGFEVFNAYSELNDPIDQRSRWQEEKKLAKEGFEEAQVMDEDYIRALEYGMPPTAGWGMGIDRFTAIVTDSASLKDVIIFPTLKPERQKKS